MKLRKSVLSYLQAGSQLVPIANTSNHAACDVLAKRERSALDHLPNNFDAEADDDTALPTEYVTQEEGEYCTNQTSEVPRGYSSSRQSDSVDIWMRHCIDRRKGCAEVVQNHYTADVT
jgi:hypothetical protein